MVVELLRLADYITWTFRWGCSSVGRALRSQRRGRQFEPAQLHFGFWNVDFGFWNSEQCQAVRARKLQSKIHIQNPKSKMILAVLDGELAVPCNPQPAPAGSNTHNEVAPPATAFRFSAFTVWSRAAAARPTPSGPEGSSGKRSVRVPRGSRASVG